MPLPEYEQAQKAREGRHDTRMVEVSRDERDNLLDLAVTLTREGRIVEAARVRAIVICWGEVEGGDGDSES